MVLTRAYHQRMSKFLTPKQAASVLSVHPETLRKWESKGRISSQRTPGNHRRFLEQDVADLKKQMGEGAFERENQIQDNDLSANSSSSKPLTAKASTSKSSPVISVPGPIENKTKTKLSKITLKLYPWLFLALVVVAPLASHYLVLKLADDGWPIAPAAIALNLFLSLCQVMLMFSLLDNFEKRRIPRLMAFMVVVAGLAGCFSLYKDLRSIGSISHRQAELAEQKDNKEFKTKQANLLASIKCQKGKAIFSTKADFISEESIHTFKKTFKLEEAAAVAVVECND